jgi:hypothetical protein
LVVWVRRVKFGTRWSRHCGFRVSVKG